MTNTTAMVLDDSHNNDNIIKKEHVNSRDTDNENNKSLKGTNVRSTRSSIIDQVEEDDHDNEEEDEENVYDDGSKKRRKLTSDERLKRNRERNRMHARKTRERKKKQSFALQQRISELQSESNQLRQIIDDRFTACALLGLSQETNQAGEKIPILSSATICKKSNFDIIDSSDSLNIDHLSPSTKSPTNKRVRRRGKYSPQERERIRRERNRMHAKRTRDKKKMFLEASEQIISEMENESRVLREYLVSAKLISVEYCAESEQRAMQSKKELALLKAYSLQHDGNDDEQDEDDDEDQDNEGKYIMNQFEDNDDEQDEDQDNEVKYIMNQFEDNEDGDDDQEGYHSGSDEKGSWNGSNDGSNQDSTNGETSGDGNNSGSDKGNRTFSSASDSSTSSKFDRSLSVRSSIEGSNGSDNGNSGTSDNGNSGDDNSDNGTGDGVNREDAEKYRNTTIGNFLTS